MSISLIQEILNEEGLDGWLLYDFHGINPHFRRVLNLPASLHITRRVFYWIPKKGEPIKISHKIEKHVFNGIPGISKLYAKREELEDSLKFLSGKIAMEYSREIPYLSFVDGGTIDFIRGNDLIHIVSSGALIQKLLSTLSSEQIQSHKIAAKFLDKVVMQAFDFIKQKLPHEKEVSDFIVQKMHEDGFITNHSPIVARGSNSANPHYEPKGMGEKFQKGDFILIDLWCKKNEEKAVFADITRVGILGKPTDKMMDVFAVVREAQIIGASQVRVGQIGALADEKARIYLESRGYEGNILHRLGHSIDVDLHGSGANLDSFESYDTRKLIPNTCYSVEPALYFPGEFGIRLEHDILISEQGFEITGGVQEEILVL
jgi:Xaa-Pro dipeptidase